MADQTPTRTYVELGALCPRLHEQLSVFGVTETETEPLQIDAVRLSYRGLLSEGEKARARKKLLRKIQAFINERDQAASAPAPGTGTETTRR